MGGVGKDIQMYVWNLHTCVATKAVPKSVQKKAVTTPALSEVRMIKGRLPKSDKELAAGHGGVGRRAYGPCSNMLAVVIAWKAKDTAYNMSMARISILPGTTVSSLPGGRDGRPHTNSCTTPIRPLR
jgi:hypothetical protein